MGLSYAGTLAGILFRPSSTFRRMDSELPIDAVLYFGGSLAFLVAVLTAASLAGLNRFLCWPWSFVTDRFPFPGSIPFFLFVMIAVTAMWSIGALFWLFVAGGRGFINTMRAVLFSFIPVLLFSWIPYIGFLTIPWALIIYVFALQELDRIPFSRAVLATAGMLLIPLIRGGFLLLALLSSPSGIAAVSDMVLLSPSPDLPQEVLAQADLPEVFSNYKAGKIHPERFTARDRQYGCLEKYQLWLSQDAAKTGDATFVDSTLAVYPAGTAAGDDAKAEDSTHVKINGGQGTGGIACPALGEVSFCHKYVSTDMNTGSSLVRYKIIFAKNNRVAIFSSSGPAVNTTLVDEVARRAAAKIP